MGVMIKEPGLYLSRYRTIRPVFGKDSMGRWIGGGISRYDDEGLSLCGGYDILRKIPHVAPTVSSIALTYVGDDKRLEGVRAEYWAVFGERDDKALNLFFRALKRRSLHRRQILFNQADKVLEGGDWRPVGSPRGPSLFRLTACDDGIELVEGTVCPHSYALLPLTEEQAEEREAKKDEEFAELAGLVDELYKSPIDETEPEFHYWLYRTEMRTARTFAGNYHETSPPLDIKEKPWS